MAMENVFKVNKDMMEDGAESMKKLFEVNSQYFSECIELAQTAQGKLVEIKTAAGLMEPVSYTHLTLPTNREV